MWEERRVVGDSGEGQGRARAPRRLPKCVAGAEASGWVATAWLETHGRCLVGDDVQQQNFLASMATTA